MEKKTFSISRRSNIQSSILDFISNQLSTLYLCRYTTTTSNERPESSTLSERNTRHLSGFEFEYEYVLAWYTLFTFPWRWLGFWRWFAFDCVRSPPLVLSQHSTSTMFCFLDGSGAAFNFKDPNNVRCCSLNTMRKNSENIFLVFFIVREDRKKISRISWFFPLMTNLGEYQGEMKRWTNDVE